MRLLSFDPLRTFDIPGVRYLKPEWMFRHRAEIAESDWVLFPEYWQVNALVYGMGRRLFPSPASYHLGHDKPEMTRAFWAICPQHVPETRILASTDDAERRIPEEFDFPFVVKEPRSSMGRGVRRIDDAAAWRAYARSHPVLYVQEYLPIDRDLRVVWVGDEVVTAYWRVGPPDAFHHNVARGARILFDGVPDEPLALVTDVATRLGVDHAGFDLACVGGRWFLLEFNTLFGNQALTRAGIALGPRIQALLERRGAPAIDPDPRPLPRAG